MTVRGVTIAREAVLSQRLASAPVSCGSFVVVHRRSGKAVLETYSLAVAAAINQAEYDVLTSLEWLQRINRGA